MSGRGGGRALLMVISEALASLVLVLAAFGLFMAILYYLFPVGTPLRELIEGAPERGGRLAEERKAEATLAYVVKDVRLRRSNSIAWGAARQGMTLYTRDAVQTFDDSEARISFTRRDLLTLGSNSLVLVDKSVDEDERGPHTVRVAVSGDVRGNISGSGRLLLELAAAGRVARFGRQGGSFRITGENRSATLSVYAGEAELIAKGRTLRVPANYGVTLGEGGGNVFALPPPPTKTGPQRAQYRYRQLPPRLDFSWTGAEGRYHLQIAKDETFSRLVKDLTLDSPRYSTGVLDQGVYFWRVSRIDRGAEGRFSAPWRLQLEQRVGPPTLRVDFPEGQLETELITLSGVSDPGNRVFVNGRERVLTGEGTFSVPLQLKRGVNLIRVEALDEAGNASYASRVVYGKF